LLQKEILKAKYSNEALLLTMFLRDVLVVLKQLSIIEPKKAAAVYIRNTFISMKSCKKKNAVWEKNSSY
jgi:hypothetical protein